MKTKQLLLVIVPVIVLSLALAFWFMRDEAGAPSPTDPNTKTQPTKPEIIKVTGEIICLPHKDTSGPQTLECALGIKDEKGGNYSIRTSSSDQIGSLPTGKKVTVTARLEQAAPTSSYDTVGALQILSVNPQ